jgi:hypothetical protein
MRGLIVGFLLSAAGLWALGRAVAAVRRGTIDRFFHGRGETLSFASQPFAFLGNAGMWLLCGGLVAGVGGLVVIAIDPVLALAPPAGVAAAAAATLVLRRRGGRSGDAGAGAFEALADGDREAMETRVEALPDGGERAVLQRVLATWPLVEVAERDYRQEPTRRAAPDGSAVDHAVAAEQRALAAAVLPALTGFAPTVVFVLLAPSIRFLDAAMVTAAIDASIALGAIVVWRVATREHAVFAAAARAALRRPR